MSINKETIQQISLIWRNYLQSNKKVFDTKGNELPDIDNQRLSAIKDIRDFIDQFTSGFINVYEFKTTVDSYNKRNNLWGFTATKGQMFFNQLVKNNENNLEVLTTLLKETITLPNNLDSALAKIEKLEVFCKNIFLKSPDRRKAPNPGSVSYFLSYFWQVQDAETWPILYTSLINSFAELGIWRDLNNQKDSYKYFFELNNTIKDILTEIAGKPISNWDAEHAFWNFKGNPNRLPTEKQGTLEISEPIKEDIISVTSSFNLQDYLIPKVATLIELGQNNERGSAKGSAFEKLVAEIFKLLDFEVEILGQGSGRNPDAIVRFREDNTAFILDAKAYSNGYSLGIDDRAIREYINHHCPKLYKEGYKKIGFIIISNSFRSNFDSFINEITWNTDIKRFVLLTSEALLYILAYKTKDRVPLTTIVELLIGMANPVTSASVIEKFADV